MAQLTQRDIRNQLLTTLSPDDFALVRPNLEPVTLNVRETLSLPNEPTSHVYFLDEGIGSVLVGPERTTGVEIGIIGREGLIGSSVVLGADQSPYQSFIQLQAKGWRIASGALTGAMEGSPTLHGVLLRYVNVLMVQTASTAYANADYTVEERLARWLLMCHDRADGDRIGITHEFLALMLGVRRPGVTVATHLLEGEQMIRATRGAITILNRDKLKSRAGSSYGLAEAEYERLIASMGRPEDSNLLQFSSKSPPTEPGSDR